jgi:hypothetical protein
MQTFPFQSVFRTICYMLIVNCYILIVFNVMLICLCYAILGLC